MQINKMFDCSDLPQRFAAISACFRREAGSAGKDTRGLYRVHQFQKVEQVVFCENDEELSVQIHFELLQNAEDILRALELPYRVVAVCTGDMGLGQVLKHDIETWMPSREAYGETHSCSSFHDFQARRLGIKYRDSAGRNKFVFTLNNTAIASPRILIALLENHQNEDGSIHVPQALRPYLGGRQRLELP
jgi:seryl-tRNA synthetase